MDREGSATGPSGGSGMFQRQALHWSQGEVQGNSIHGGIRMVP